jgi:hypothetical protein
VSEQRQQNPDELGALWLKTGGKGEYMTGTINGVPVVCFPNKSDNPKAPAWRVLKSKPKDAKPEAEPVTDESIPF